MNKAANICLSCSKPECDNCLEKKNIYKTPERNKEYCKEYYKRHREECIERTKRNRLKKRIENKGYEMAIYI